MTRKSWSAVGISLGALVAIYTVARLTGALVLFTAPSVSNAPSIKPGSYFFISNLMKPARGKFLAYHPDDPLNRHAFYVHRLIGMPGDIVEIKEGVSYVNGTNMDEGLALSHEYRVSRDQFKLLPDELTEPPNQWAHPDLLEDSVNINLPDAVARKNGILRLRLEATGKVDSMIQQRYGAPWNIDYFGPVRVPEGHYFVLGDNRHNALDSRYAGFIGKENVAGGVPGK